MTRLSKLMRLNAFIISLFFILIFSALYTQGVSSNKINTANGENQSYSGDYDGDLSIMYLEQDRNSSIWVNASSSTNIIPYNASFFGKEYKVRSLDIRADNLINISSKEYYNVAENTSNQISLTESYRFAQEFTAPELLRIDEIMIYVNFFLLRPCYFDIFIYDEFLREEINWGWHFENRIFVNEWISVNPGTNILFPGEKYNIVLRVWFSPGGYDNETYNYWKAENYSNPSFNKGITRRYNGVDWIQISNDNMVDLLCNFSYTEIIHPSDVDLKFIINNELVMPLYQINPWGPSGYEAFISYTFDAPLSQNINITVVTNQTVPKLDVEIYVGCPDPAKVGESFTVPLILTGIYSDEGAEAKVIITCPYEITYHPCMIKDMHPV